MGKKKSRSRANNNGRGRPAAAAAAPAAPEMTENERLRLLLRMQEEARIQELRRSFFSSPPAANQMNAAEGIPHVIKVAVIMAIVLVLLFLLPNSSKNVARIVFYGAICVMLYQLRHVGMFVCKKVLQQFAESQSGEISTTSLTWAELENRYAAAAAGRGPAVAYREQLEVVCVQHTYFVRYVNLCEDSVGDIRVVAAYTDSRIIPGFNVGKVMVWKNPRFHYFRDGTTGARIEETDLVNIRIK